jgi:plastocyanin
MTLGRRATRLLFVLTLLGAAALAAAPVLAADGKVEIVGKSYQPAELTIAVGDTVTWTVTQSIGEPHTVTSGKSGDADAGSVFDSGLSGLQENGGTFSTRFTSAGTFDYFCQVHAEMTGRIIVTEAGAEGGAGGHGEGIPTESKLIAAGILVLTLLVGFGASWLWRRQNPA